MRIKLAYSPDTDDAFMVYAMKEGLVDTSPYEIEYTSADIQTLNDAALRGVYDISAISMGAYPNISDEYMLMPVGASIGDQFGPAIVVKEASNIQSIDQLVGRRIAVPGLSTSAFFAASILLPEFTPVALPFHQIGPAILNEQVDAGILIHELQLNYAEQGFRKLDDLGSLWDNAFKLPLPLGGNAIKRSLGPDHIRALNHLYKESIEWGLNHRKETIEAASARAFQGLGYSLADRYISMYVNDNSLSFSKAVQDSMELLLTRAGEKGLCREYSANWMVEI